jgi:hypothetical protein
LGSQLTNVQERRAELAQEYERSTGVNRAGIEQRLVILDKRILQLESELSQTGFEVAGARAQIVVPDVRQRFDMNPGQVTGLSIVFTIFVLGPLSLAAARNLWRRASHPALPPGWSESSQRLERLEQAVDTIAIEIERVSESQRFMTRLMTKQAGIDSDGDRGPGAGQGNPGGALRAGG